MATYVDEGVGWKVYLAGAEDRTLVERDLADALVKLVNVARAPHPAWLDDAVDRIAGYDTPLGRRFRCPCCGFLTLQKAPPGTFALCKVCFWEDDALQFHQPDREGGANTVSLNQARENFRVHGVSEPRFRPNVRPPLPHEKP
jgi:hypothetical protein